MDKIKEIKRAINLKKRKEEIEAQAASGLSVKEWCIRNNINLKTYYYHLGQVCMFLLEKNASGEAVHEIVPISEISVSDYKQPKIGIANIVIRKDGSGSNLAKAVGYSH